MLLHRPLDSGSGSLWQEVARAQVEPADLLAGPGSALTGCGTLGGTLPSLGLSPHLLSVKLG